MSIRKVEYISVMGASRELSMGDRNVRNLCEKFDWFGGLMEPTTWVITREELERMKITPRRGAGRPRKPVITEDVMVA